MWISSISPTEAVGELKDLYDSQARTLGRPTEITIAGSLYPDLVRLRMELYEVVEACPSSLSPAERQGVALCAASGCGSDFITSGVERKFLSVGGTEDQAHSLCSGDVKVLSPAAAALARYARKVAVEPLAVSEADLASCRAVGATDLDILDANNLAGYYSYLARLCLGLGIT